MPAIILAIVIALFPSCVTEDATGCVWSAQSQGNGQGTSFVNVFGTDYMLGENK